MPFQRRFFRGCVGRSACSQDHERTAASGSTSLRRGGLTLIELLVSVTLTLIVVFAIVQVFDMLGETMTKGRATIEMAGNLRAVANRLQEDLDNLTCPVRPWIDPAAGQGYFEYVEGLNVLIPTVPQNPPCRGSDLDAYNADLGLPATSSRTAVGTSLWPGPDGKVDALGQQTHFGDLDDVLMMTIKAPNESFRGRLDCKFQIEKNPPDFTTINPIDGYDVGESEYAEVIWWTRIDPVTKTVVLHRRQLLILPDLNRPDPITGLMLVYQPAPFTPEKVKQFMHANDLSVRVVTNPAGIPIGLAANSLSDLTTPRNRFGHFRVNRENNAICTAATPFAPISVPGTDEQWAFTLDWRFLSESLNANHLVLGKETFSSLSDRSGDDLVMADVLAFDVRAYEPKAPLLVVDGNGTPLGNPGFNPATSQAMVPGSPGYNFATINSQITAGVAVPRGAFVDLMYSDYRRYQSGGATIPVSVGAYGELSQTPDDTVQGTGIAPPYLDLVFYSTWSEGFERDGVDQDNSFGPDQATNGVDDDLAGGVDDYAERETRPPYKVPLTGIEVRIRMMEFSTRQIRQVSVVGDFTD